MPVRDEMLTRQVPTGFLGASPIFCAQHDWLPGPKILRASRRVGNQILERSIKAEIDPGIVAGEPSKDYERVVVESQRFFDPVERPPFGVRAVEIYVWLAAGSLARPITIVKPISRGSTARIHGIPYHVLGLPAQPKRPVAPSLPEWAKLLDTMPRPSDEDAELAEAAMELSTAVSPTSGLPSSEVDSSWIEWLQRGSASISNDDDM
jgi:hypothetical protein